MADGQIDIKEDAAPSKSLASQTHLHGATTVHAEEIVIVDSAGNLVGQTAGRLNVDGSGVTQPVSDGGGSLTVDALDLDIRNLATGQDKVDVRLRDAADAAFIDPVIKGQLPAALVGARLDVNVGASVAIDVSDRAAREVGRVRLWDGTDEATITPLRTLPAGGTDKVLNIREIPNRLSTFAVTIATQTPAITIGVKELLALWHASTGTKDIYIVELWATAVITTASTAGRTTLRVSNITSAPTGGTELTKLDIVQGGTTDLTNAMQVKTGGGAIGTTFIRKLAEWATQTVGRIEIPLFVASNPGNGIVLPAGSNAGISIDIEREVAHTALVDLWTVGARWLEV